MTQKLRENQDANLKAKSAATDCKTVHDRYELPCSVCGRQLSADEMIIENFDDNSPRNLDNPMVCGDCARREVESPAFG
jgi:hypothetical protein